MNEKNQVQILLELALHRYDEEVERNEEIDNKNKSMVAFLGVMLTIQFTILPRLIGFRSIFSSFEMSILFIIYLLSLIFYFSSLLLFILTLINLEEIKTAPRIDGVVEFASNDKPFKYIVDNTLISLNDCVEFNDEILNEKNFKGNLGLILMKLGIISTTIFIIYIITIIN
ncbi:MAG: hypothetical protein IJ122_07340 [Methanobrevibacter sp.]|nr:hypothetical protein [Methanobrevibacter sp.]